VSAKAANDRPTQEERRTATRARVANAAADVLAQNGYATLTTRAVAREAGVSQPTVMHYFTARGLLLTEAMGLLCDRIVDEVEALSAGLASAAESAPAMLDHLWDGMKSPAGVAIGQVWCAAWSNPELSPVVADFDRRHVDATLEAMRRVYPPDVDAGRLAAFVELALATLKGTLLLRPVVGPAELDERWAIVRPPLAQAAADVLDDAGAPSRRRI